MPLNQPTIDRLRRAQSLTIAERSGIASIACRGTAVPSGHLASRLVALFRDDRFEVPIQTSIDPEGGRRGRWPTAREDLVFELSDAVRDPGWAALTRALTPGGSITVDWSRDGLTRRRRAEAVRLTTVAPFGMQETFQLNPSKGRSSRRRRRRMRPIRAAAALVGLALLAASTSAVTTLALALALIFLLAFARLAGSRRLWNTFRLGRFSFLAGLWSMLPSIAVVVTTLLVGVWLFRRRRSIQRVVRFLRARRDPGPGPDPAPPDAYVGNGDGRIGALGSATGDARLDAIVRHFEKHVANVARMLDHLVPGWHLRVDISRLEAADPADHLLTAAFLDDSAKALDELLRLLKQDNRLGFVPCVHAALKNAPCDHLPRTQDDSHGVALVQCWTGEIRRRLHASVPA